MKKKERTERIAEEIMVKNYQIWYNIYEFTQWRNSANFKKYKHREMHWHIFFEKQRQREHLEGSNKETTCNIEDILNKIKRIFLSRNHGGQKDVK